MGIGGYYFLYQGGKLPSPATPPSPTATPTSTRTEDWKTHTYMNFEFQYPGDWVVDEGGLSVRNKDNNEKFSVATNLFGDSGLPSCKVESTPINIDGKSSQKKTLAFCKSDKLELSPNECSSTPCIYTVESELCLDGNLNPYMGDGGCEWATKFEGFTLYQFHLECNEYKTGESGKESCNQLYDQILSTFQFLD